MTPASPRPKGSMSPRVAARSRTCRPASTAMGARGPHEGAHEDTAAQAALPGRRTRTPISPEDGVSLEDHVATKRRPEHVLHAHGQRLGNLRAREETRLGDLRAGSREHGPAGRWCTRRRSSAPWKRGRDPAGEYTRPAAPPRSGQRPLLRRARARCSREASRPIRASRRQSPLAHVRPTDERPHRPSAVRAAAAMPTIGRRRRCRAASFTIAKAAAGMRSRGMGACGDEARFMRLVTFRTQAQDRGGLLLDDEVVDLAESFAWLEEQSGPPADPAQVAARSDTASRVHRTCRRGAARGRCPRARARRCGRSRASEEAPGSCTSSPP